MRNLLQKERQKKELPPHKSKSVAALPCNLPFATTHMLFLQPTGYNDIEEVKATTLIGANKNKYLIICTMKN